VVWTLKLRPSIKFTDGTPYDAAAVAFNWNRIADPKTASTLGSFVTQIQSLDVVDATTLRITLKAKNGSFPTSVVQISLIGSPTALQQRGSQFANNPVGAGPFVLKSWTKGSQMVLARNPSYWNAPLPYLDQVIIKPVLDEQQRVNTLTSGQATMLWTRSTGSEQTAEKSGNVVPHVLAQSGGTNMYFNTRKAPFNDIRVRQAFTMALDRAQYAKVVNNNVTPPEQSIFLEQSPFYDSSITQLPYDAAKAQSLFDQVAAETGGPVTFTITAFNVQTQITQSEYMQGVLNAFKNVKVNVEQVAVAQGITQLNSGNFQVILAGLYFIDPEPILTAKFVCTASPSVTGWCNPKFDADVADAKSTLDPNQRIADIKDMQKIFYNDVPSLFYDRGYSWMIAAPSVQNFDYVNDGWILLDRTWMKH
jgi:peptide/nickel transport system substrate-binding protein